MKILDLLSRLKRGGHAGRDGAFGSDNISVARGYALSDRVQEKATWNIHRFEPELYDRLAHERRRVADALVEGHRLLTTGQTDRAGEFFRRGLDLQERLVNSRSYESSIINGNALLNEGINAITTLICGGTETAFNNANAQLGVGSATATALTGTITVTQWSATVAGVGTLFTTELAVGDWIKATTSVTWYRVKAIATATSLTIEKAFEEATETGVTGYKLAAASTDLPAGTNTWVGMDTGYPTFGSGQNMVFQSVFNSATGNQAWNCFSVRNGVTANKNMNLKFSAQGTKATGTWTLNLTVSLV